MKYIKIEVTRVQGTLVYLKVPDNFTFKDISQDLLRKSTKATVTENDWDSFGWEETIESQSMEFVPQDEGERFLYYEVK